MESRGLVAHDPVPTQRSSRRKRGRVAAKTVTSRSNPTYSFIWSAWSLDLPCRYDILRLAQARFS